MHEEFIKGKGNEAAFSVASQIVSGEVKETKNPFVIIGGTGVGKSALLQWIVNHMKEGKAKIIDTSRFIEHLVWLLGVSNAEDSIKVLLADEDYGLYDAFLFENIDMVLQGKSVTQDFFIDIIEVLLSKDMQVVLTTNHRMEEFVDKLEMRFSGTAVTTMKPLDQELKVAVARKKMEERGLNFTDQEIESIANEAETGAQIEGIMNRLAIEREIGV